MTEENVTAVPDIQPTTDSAQTIAQDSNLAAVSQPAEKTLSQTEVNNLIASVKRKAYDKGVAESSRQTAANVPHGTTASNVADEAAIGSIIDRRMEALRVTQEKEIQQKQLNDEATRVCEKLNSDAIEYKKDNPDYEKDMGRVGNFMDAVGILHATHTLDNSAEVLHYLANNPHEVPALNALCMNDRTRAAGEHSIKKIADRLRENKSAKNASQSSKPVGHIKTNVRDGIGDTAFDDSNETFNNFFRT